MLRLSFKKSDINDIKDVEIMVLSKYLSNFWRTLEIPLINCEINLILTWKANCFVVANTVANQLPTFAKANTKLYVPVVTLCKTIPTIEIMIQSHN